MLKKSLTALLLLTLFACTVDDEVTTATLLADTHWKLVSVTNNLDIDISTECQIAINELTFVDDKAIYVTGTLNENNACIPISTTRNYTINGNTLTTINDNDLKQKYILELDGALLKATLYELVYSDGAAHTIDANERTVYWYTKVE